MEVQLIENKELLESVELFKIENLLWGTEKIAKTYGYIGFVPGDGLYTVSYTHLTLPTIA